jgi:hypothetical protein
MRISRTPSVTPRSTPAASLGRRGAPGPSPRNELYIWTSLVPRLLHPTKLAIVEALIEAGGPQSVDGMSLLPMVDGKPEEIRTHATGMVEVGALEVVTIQIKAGNEVPLYFFPRPEG